MSPPEGGNHCHPATSTSCEADTLTSLLTSTATNLQIRTEVSSVLTTLLNDVETTSTLSAHLVHKSRTTSLQNQLTAAQTALAESRALAQHESQRRQQLGDVFLAELAKLSLKLEELEGWRSDNEGRVQEHDVLKRRFEEMTDRAQALELAVQEGQGGQAAQADAQVGPSPTTEQKGGAVGANTSASTTAGVPQVEAAAAASSEDVVGGVQKGDANATEREKADAHVNEKVAPDPLNAVPANPAESADGAGVVSNANDISDVAASTDTTKAADGHNTGESTPTTSDTASADAEPEVTADNAKEEETGTKDTACYQPTNEEEGPHPTQSYGRCRTHLGMRPRTSVDDHVCQSGGAGHTEHRPGQRRHVFQGRHIVWFGWWWWRRSRRWWWEWQW